ncbi:MAG: RagB/SusD family nutrient uptake outer membrane protein [Cyclobacteriaceae bacterium]
MKSIKKISIKVAAIIFLVIGQVGCDFDQHLDQQPLAQLSESTFWTSASDAKLALTGIYRVGNVGRVASTNEHLIMASYTDDSSYKFGSPGVIYAGYLNPGDGQVVGSIWNRAYQAIFRANYFLENIDKVDMDSQEKAELTAEARFLRAYEYFYMSVLYGGVPLITNVLTVEEANTQSRNSLQEVQNFSINELSEAAQDLPVSRPDDEKGRILKAAALAVQGRLLMIQEKWGEAADTYKQIIDLNEHIIDPRFKALFTVEGEGSKEIILHANHIAGLYGNSKSQKNYHPAIYGGYQEDNAFQNLVDAFLMEDGLPIEESPLYDPENPFENRDPRIYETLFLPGYTEFEGQLYPNDPNFVIVNLHGATGYGWKKYIRENYSGDTFSSGDDIVHIRYAEVLLSYLESKIENGDNITQNLLDETINEVRSREAVDMPPVIETNRDELREIVRRERRVEFALERLIRYMDIRRWDIFMDVMNRQFYGMKITDDPENYDGGYEVETSGKYRGHYKVIDRTGHYQPYHKRIPIPLSEIDINPNLEQNPGY